jgi:cystathionine beta-lyase/cystathionine gamma-synthase
MLPMRLDPADVAACVADDGPRDLGGAAPMSTPVIQTSLFGYPTFGALADALSAEYDHHVYSRGQNPTVEALERKLAKLERGEMCKCFGSGMAAIHAVMFGLLRQGDHIVFANQVYGPTLQLAREFARLGVTHDVVLDTSIDAIARALTPATRLIWLESPGTMLMRVLDVSAVADLARARGIITCMDNSWSTPLLQTPIEMGIDLVVHSATKYLAGHSDLMAGVLVGTRALMLDIFRRGYMLNGGILAPFEAWLLLRGMRTLPVRLAQHEADGLRVAEFLRAHPAVQRVYYPAFDESPDLVARQMRGLTGLMSFALDGGDFARVSRFIDALRCFRIGVSWGGVESIVISPERRGGDDHLAAQQIPRGVVRLSVGLEGADTLIADIDAALAAATR